MNDRWGRDVNPYDHFRAGADAPVQEGVYRVVGTGEETVTLLRLTDGEGRRTNSGDVEQVDRSTIEGAFEPADDPDAGVSLSDLIAPVTTLPSALRHWLGL